MIQITFKDIYTLGNIVDENNQYIHVHYDKMLSRYDSNFIEFKELPSVVDFKEAEEFLKDYHVKRDQNHVKFYFPENTKPTEELYAYLNETGYEIGFLELYAIQPKHFPLMKNCPEIDIQAVTEENLETFLNLQYHNDLEFGVEFAKQKVGLIKRQFEDPTIRQVLAYYKDSPAGYVELIVSDETVEIDNLSVEELFRNKGIGSRLQSFAMELFPNRTVILVADGEDTPREMYRKQNYAYQGFKYEVIKID
ncbi:GNAT family N-acetyltransferase [Sporosarcina sp.]|uniref:GNAT family N-acetyltransferase n=1 Tax=Sporosarcina sp. TaxID=49982 RepID=UPI002625D36A|nr:GNAT family N-acetyltransferase [Sporosarcina sp.]